MIYLNCPLCGLDLAPARREAEQLAEDCAPCSTRTGGALSVKLVAADTRDDVPSVSVVTTLVCQLRPSAARR